MIKNHENFKALSDAVSNDKDKAAVMAKIMFDEALLIAGLPIQDTVGSADRIFGLF